MLGRPRSVAVGYYVAVTLLVVGLLIGVALVTRIAGPSHGLEVAEPVASVCATGSGSPGCYDIAVRNTAAAPISALCVVLPATGTIARFAEGQSTTSLTFAPGDEQLLRVTVDAETDDPIVPPDIECTPVSG